MLKQFRLLGLVLGVTALTFAQTSTSEFTGTVKDSTGAVVPGANVTIVNDETGVSNKQSTSTSGNFDFPAMPVGSYTLTVEATGFKTAKLTKNTLAVNTPLSVTVNLEIGTISDVVAVEGKADVLQTTNATIGTANPAACALVRSSALLVCNDWVFWRNNSAKWRKACAR
mgnify:CR=1 FL=1